MKLIFESLNDDKIAINEGVSELVFPILFGVAWVGTLHIITKLLERLVKIKGVSKPKDAESAKKVKKDLKKELRVLKSIAKIVEGRPKFIYNVDCDIYEYIKMGVIDTTSLRKYISTFKDKIVKNSNEQLEYIWEGNGEHGKSHEQLTKMNAIYIISDGGGNSQWITSSNKLFDWDHETHILKDIGTYEDFILKNLEYIEYRLEKDGLLLSIDDNEEEK